MKNKIFALGLMGLLATTAVFSESMTTTMNMIMAVD